MGNRKNEMHLWKCLVKWFDAAKPKYKTLFKVVGFLTNFLYKILWTSQLKSLENIYVKHNKPSLGWKLMTII